LETTTDELARGTLFAGRYEIIEELGVGGMGRVYRAHDTKLNEEVALKLIQPEIAADKRTVERFRNEIKNARKISHPNVCRTHDLGEEGKTLYLTMEYIRGEDLKSLIHRMKVLAVGSAVSVGRQIAEGLAEAHKQGIVHRDLKPGNVMIDKDGQAKIMDFGIARSLVGGGITGEGAIIGTPEYMSPEQVEGKPADVRADIYALGIILFEMVTGRVPFEGETAFSIANKHKTELPPIPKKLAPQIPEGLSRLILKCLEKDKAKRYQTADDLIIDLAAVEQALPTVERIAPRRKTLTHREVTFKFSLKKPLIPVVGIVALAVVAFVVWRFLPKKGAAPLATSGKPSLAILQFDNTSGDKSLDYLKFGLSDLLTIGIDQSKFVNVRTGDQVYSALKKLDLLETTRYSTEDLQRVAREAGVEHIASGGILKVGDKIVITLTFQKPLAGEIVRTSRVECDGEKDIIAGADELIRQIKLDLALTPEQITQDGDPELGRVTTPFTEAFKYYSEGRSFHSQMEYAKSISLMEKAVAIDPEFALAYRSMSAAYYGIGDPVKSLSYIEKAFRLSDRVTEKERLLIQGDYHLKRGERDYDKAIEAYRKMAELYPDWEAANLALIYNQVEDWQEAVKLMEKKLSQGHPFVHFYLASAYMGLGSYEKSREICRYYLDHFSKDNKLVLFTLWGSYISEGRFEDALKEKERQKKGSAEQDYKALVLKGEWSKAEKLCVDPSTGSVDPGSLAAVRLGEGRLREAIEEMQKAVALEKKPSNQRQESSLRVNLAHGLLRSAHYDETIQECRLAAGLAEEAGNYSQQIHALDLMGTAQLEMNSPAEAQKTAEELKILAEKTLNKKLVRHYFHLMGLIELKKGLMKQAIDDLERSVSLLSGQAWDWGTELNLHAYFIDSLAAAYYQVGDLAKAREQYLTITKLGSGRIEFGDIYAKAFYMLGKIAEQQRDKARAIANYGKFLDLWKNADAGLPEVEDAKKRLAGLAGS